MVCSTSRNGVFMQAQKLSSRTISITLLLSLLFHCALLFFLLVNNPPKKQQQFLLGKKNKNQLWATCNKKVSAPIFFMPTPKQPSPAKTATQPTNTQLKTPPQSALTKDSLDKSSPGMLTRQTTNSTQPTTIKKITALVHKKAAQDAKKFLTQTLTEPKKNSLSKKTQPAQLAKPNLLQIAHGFFDHMKKNGKSSVNIIGNDKAKPTEQQLREERYLERLNACIHNAYSIHRHQSPHLGREKKALQVRVSLNKLGNLIDLQLLDSCGNRHVDQFIMFLFRDAASSFPPLPSYVQHDPYTLNYKIFVNNKTSNPIQALFN